MENERLAGGQTILVVEDDEAQLSSIAHFLEREGFKTARALSGPEAIRYLESTACDLVLLDVSMPGMDGFEVCKRIRSNEKMKKIPIIFLTARAATLDYRTGLKSGGDTYVTKPFRNSQLLNVINTMLAIRRR